jgi:deoxyribodipyrimidine photo-lyase
MDMNVFWHRRDLRLPDNRGLACAAADDDVLAVFVVEPDLVRQVGERQRAFLFAGLARLREAYRERGADLLVREGDPARVLATVYDAVDADTVYYNRHYRPARRNRARRVDRRLPTEVIIDLVLVDPDDLAPEYPHHGGFHDDWTARPKPAPVDAPPADALVDPGIAAGGQELATDEVPTLAADIDLPEAGYEAARARYDQFLADGIESYADTRDDMEAAVERPVGAVSRMSPYLAGGMIGIREMWADATDRWEAAAGDARRNVGKYRDELSWREFHYHLLAHNPSVVTRDYVDFERRVAWRNDPSDLLAWKRGETGYPFVDAGMRQLAREGYVHNRPRQVVASFLTKHLLVDWREGARHFAEQLVDHDPAANYGNWQWVASTGTDSVDVRIFDPVAQLAKYDPETVYVREYVPELSDVPPEKIVDWPTLPRTERESLAPDYRHPIVDRDEAYERAQRVFETALGKR